MLLLRSDGNKGKDAGPIAKGDDKVLKKDDNLKTKKPKIDDKEKKDDAKKIDVPPPNDGPKVVPPDPGPKDIVAPAKLADGQVEFLADLPNIPGLVYLAADGSRVVYGLPGAGRLGYRQGPAFDAEQEITIPDILGLVRPVGVSPDGQKVALSTGTKAGGRVLVWDWAGKKIAASMPVAGAAIRVFSRYEIPCHFLRHLPKGRVSDG